MLDANGGYKESREEYIKRRTRELNVSINSNPKDVDLWNQLIAFQDEIIGATTNSRKSKAIADKKMEIFKRKSPFTSFNTVWDDL